MWAPSRAGEHLACRVRVPAPRGSERQPLAWLPADSLAWGLRGSFTLGISDFYGGLGAAAESDSRC